MTFKIISFGFGSGERPPHADLVIDCRLIQNPHKLPLLRKLDGRDPGVRRYVQESRGYWQVMRKAIEFAQANPEATVAFGCLGGRHRSVALAEILRESLAASHPERVVKVEHRRLKA